MGQDFISSFSPLLLVFLIAFIFYQLNGNNMCQAAPAGKSIRDEEGRFKLKIIQSENNGNNVGNNGSDKDHKVQYKDHKKMLFLRNHILSDFGSRNEEMVI